MIVARSDWYRPWYTHPSHFKYREEVSQSKQTKKLQTYRETFQTVATKDLSQIPDEQKGGRPLRKNKQHYKT
jgi:hypothetical protein